MTRRIGVLLSGRGSNFEALAESCAAGRIPDAEIALVLSNREGAPGIERARATLSVGERRRDLGVGIQGWNKDHPAA